MKKKIVTILAIMCTGAGLLAQSAEQPAEKLKIGARVQARIMGGQVDSKYAQSKDFDAIDFNFRRIRLSAKYEGASWWGGLIDIKGENLLAAGKSAIQEANIWLKPGFWESKAVIGQFKIPFLREQLNSSGTLFTPERSMSAEFIQQQDIGIMFSFNPLYAAGDFFHKRALLSLSWTNGDGSGHDGIGRKVVEAETAGEPIASLANWRFEFVALGKLTGYGKEMISNDPYLSIGAAGAYTDSSELGMFTGDYKGHTFDITFAFSGVYLMGEYTMFQGTNIAKGTSNYQGTLGYNLRFEKLFVMPVLRYDAHQSDANGDMTIQSAEKTSDFWIGVNMLVPDHSFKVQLFYQLVNLADTTKKEDVVYFQVQSNFGKSI